MMDNIKGMSKEGLMKELLELYWKIDNDPKEREEAEEYQKRFGILNEKELNRTITV